MDHFQDQVFGNSAAEQDDLLYQCPVNPETPASRKPILMGRWGTGKSALILLHGQRQSELLGDASSELARVWYITEKSIDATALASFQNSLAGDQRLLSRTLEAVWRGHIVRAYSRTLDGLSERYANTQGSHWGFVHRIARGGSTAGTIWNQLGRVVTLISGETERQKSLESIQDTLEAILQREAVVMLQRCLQDIDPDAGELVPIVAVEPIETPSSSFESNGGLANALVTSLLNVFLSNFQPSQDNHIRVRISVPWHRYDPFRLDFPQKTRQYVGELRWTRGRLREFINKRIEWEFRRVRRHFAPKPSQDAWAAMFGERIANGVCEPRVMEDSFCYFLRHTHHRARDLQNLARRAVEAQAESWGCSVDDVLRGSRGPVTPGVIKEMFRLEGPQATTELLIEAGRKYPEMMQAAEHLRGLAIPFNLDKLRERMQRAGLDMNRALDMLWSAGVLGVTAVPANEAASSHMIAVLAEEAHLSHANDAGSKFHRWCWFEYNFEGSPSRLMENLREMKDVTHGMILHSKAVEYFAPHSVDRSSPIGI